MAEATTKQRLIDAVEQLPADATFEDAMERIYFLYKIEKGLAQADAGKVIPHAEVKKRLGL